MKITYYGHSCFGIEVAGKNIVLDPFITPNSLAGERLKLYCGPDGTFDLSKIPADYIFLSHGHADHVADAIALAKVTGATIVGIWEIYEWAIKNGVEKSHPMNKGGEWVFEFGTVKMVQAVHSSSLPDGSYGGDPAGWLFMTDEANIYFAGDTALTLDMQLIPRWTKLDAAMLPIGSNFTMTWKDAMLASDFIHCNNIIGMHYDTFGFIKINHEECQEAFERAGKKLHLMEIGSQMEITKHR